MAQKFHFTLLQIEVTRASRGLSVIAELLVYVSWRHHFLDCVISFTSTL